jgi:adenylate cyclase class 2
MIPSEATAKSAIEVEQKFRLEQSELLLAKLMAEGAIDASTERHADTYYRHPCRDFAQTREALRIRRITGQDPAAPGVEVPDEDSQTLVTYKGPYVTTGVKARPELEWRIDPADQGGENMHSLLLFLGFTPVMTVRKTRRSFTLVRSGRPVIIAIDQAERLGTFAEIEMIASDDQDAQRCREQIGELAHQFDLRHPERKSYLTMTLELVASETTPP